MKRIVVLGLLVVGVAWAPPDVATLWNTFAECTKAWVPLEMEFLGNPVAISPVGAQRRWQECREAFHEVDVVVRGQ